MDTCNNMVCNVTLLNVYLHDIACNVKWLGLRGDDLHLLPEQSLLPLKQKDLQIAKSLMSSEILQVNYPAPKNVACYILLVIPCQGLSICSWTPKKVKRHQGSYSITIVPRKEK